MRKLAPVTGLFLVAILCASSAFAQAPRLFFSDLTRGPASGGESVNGFSGAYVTLYGDFFGTSPNVTWNGQSCLRVVPVNGKSVNSWLWYQKLVVQLGPTCAAGTGNFVASNGTSDSNGI